MDDDLRELVVEGKPQENIPNRKQKREGSDRGRRDFDTHRKCVSSPVTSLFANGHARLPFDGN